jgi:DNA-binding CsgD family transcriptional regulator
VAVPVLARGDAERLLRFVGEAESLGGDDPFTGDLLVELGRLGLTTREREVLTWVARGKTNSEIARLLSLAPSTVSKHLENVYAKLGVKTRTAAVARFLGIDVEGGDGESIVSAQS